MLLLGAAAANAGTPAAKVLIFAATIPCSSRLDLALAVFLELRLCCWRGSYGCAKTTGCQVGLHQTLALGYSSIYVDRGEFGTRYLSVFNLICFCSAWPRTKRTRKKCGRSFSYAGADSRGWREAQDRSGFCCILVLLLVASAAACCCCCT